MHRLSDSSVVDQNLLQQSSNSSFNFFTSIVPFPVQASENSLAICKKFKDHFIWRIYHKTLKII